MILFGMPPTKFFHGTRKEAYVRLASNIDLQSVSYPSSHRFVVNNIGVLGVDYKERHFYDMEMPRMSDIIHGFGSNIAFDFVIGDQVVSPKLTDAFLFFICPYTPIKIRFYIDTETKNFYINYTSVILSISKRNKYQNIGGEELVYSSIVYKHGSCAPEKNIFTKKEIVLSL